MIVTTFSPEGYEYYGKRFIETYKKHCKYTLVVYVEDDLEIEGVDVRSLYDIPGCADFIKIVKYIDMSQFSGQVNSYRMNVNKFCRKVFAIFDASKTEEKFAFIGADTVFFKDIPDNFLEDILDSVYIAYLGRKRFHSETDFIAFNPEFSGHNLFMSMFIRMYTTGAFQDMKYWCDSDVFDHVRKLLGIPENNLNVTGNEDHPFVTSILGQYMDHLKGPQRKALGHSFKDDYTDKPRVQIGTV